MRHILALARSRTLTLAHSAPNNNTSTRAALPAGKPKNSIIFLYRQCMLNRLSFLMEGTLRIYRIQAPTYIVFEEV